MKKRRLAIIRFSVYTSPQYAILLLGGMIMFAYITPKAAAENWKISERRVQNLCEEKQIEGVIRFGHAWAIPVYAQKPVDKRKKSEQTKSNLNHGML